MKLVVYEFGNALEHVLAFLWQVVEIAALMHRIDFL